LRHIPETVREACRSLSTQEKQGIARRLKGTTGFLFFKVQNHQAFIDGKVGGIDIFQHMREQLQKQINNGKLERSRALHLPTSRPGSGLSAHPHPRQRAAMVELLEIEVAGL
jgi:hypothetical protein